MKRADCHTDLSDLTFESESLNLKAFIRYPLLATHHDFPSRNVKARIVTTFTPATLSTIQFVRVAHGAALVALAW